MMKNIKITNIIELPVEQLSSSGKVRYLGDITPTSFVLIGEDNILFCDFNGNIIEKIEVQQGAFGMENLTCNFSLRNKKKSAEVVLTLYKISSNNKLIQDIFTFPIKTKCNFAVDGFIKTCHVKCDGIGRFLVTYEDNKWKQEYLLPQKVIDQYTTKKSIDLIEANTKDHMIGFISKSTGDVYLYDYHQEKEIQHFQLPFHGEFYNSFFSDNSQWYITLEQVEGKKNFYVYDLSTYKAEITKKNIIDFQLDEKHEKIAFVLPNNTIELYEFFSMKLLAKRKFTKKEVNLLDPTLRIQFCQELDRLMLITQDEAFVLEWSEIAVENFNRKDISSLIENICQKVETWQEDDIKEVLKNIEKMKDKERRKVYQTFEERYADLLGEDHEFWK